MKNNGKTRFSKGWEITVAKTFEDIEAIRSTWEDMQRKESYPIINADIERYLSVIKAMRNDVQPHIMLLRRKSHPIAMIIGRIENKRIECKIAYKTLFRPALRCLTVVYGGVLGQPNTEICSTIVSELIQVLQKGEADVIFFNQLRTGSDMYRAVKDISGFLSGVSFSKVHTHWQIFLPESADKAHEMISKKHQRDINRYVRKLEKACSGPVNVVLYHKRNNIEEFIDIASRITVSTYKNALGVGFTNNALTLSLLRQAEKNKWLRAYVLYAHNEPVAFEMGSIYGNVYFAEHKSFDPRWKSYGPGTILQLRLFEELSSERGVNIYDYGFGDAAYKRRFGSVSWPEASVYIFAPRLRPLCINLLQSALGGLSSGLNYFSDKAGLTRWVKRTWRNHLQKKNQ